MKTVAFKVPAMDGGKIVHIEKQGSVVWLDLGGKREKFVLQFEGIDNRPRYVTHYATGHKMPGDLQQRAIGQLMSQGHAHRPDYRKMAQALVDEVIAENGAERVRKVISAAAVLNK